MGATRLRAASNTYPDLPTPGFRPRYGSTMMLCTHHQPHSDLHCTIVPSIAIHASRREVNDPSNTALRMSASLELGSCPKKGPHLTPAVSTELTAKGSAGILSTGVGMSAREKSMDRILMLGHILAHMAPLTRCGTCLRECVLPLVKGHSDAKGEASPRDPTSLF